MKSDDDASWGTGSSQALSISPYRTLTATPSPPPSMLSFSITDMERSAFDFFCIRMAGPMEIMSPAKGWVRQALQVSSGSKAVFHAIAALSSANLAMASIQHPTLPGLHRPEKYSDALDQYSKTIAALHRQIKTVMEGHGPLEPVLLTCLLLMCYELHAERSSMAIRHHTMGHDIVKKHLSGGAGGPAISPGGSSSLQQLADAFAVLALGSNYPGNDNAASAAPDRSAQQLIIPLHLTHELQLSNAWDQLDQLIDAGNALCGRLYHFTARHVTAIYGESLDPSTRYCLASCWSRSIELPAHDTTLVEIDALLNAHRQWAAVVSGVQDPHPKTARGFALLQIRQWFSAFTLATCRQTRELCMDAHEDDFNRVLDLAQFYLESDNLVPRPTRPRSMYGNGQDDVFCLEEGILSPVYLISLKSRKSTTRHRAVEILASANRREGLGSSTISAQIAVAIVRVEEERARNMTPTLLATDLLSDAVPEAARFTDTVRVAGEDLHRPTCRLLGARYLHESDGRIEITEYLSKGPCFPYSNCAGKCRTGFHFEILKKPAQYKLFAPS
jgi:hypothetical protein